MPIRLERTYDAALIRSIITHPAIYEHMISDGAPSREDFEPGNHLGNSHHAVPRDRRHRAIEAYRAGLASLKEDTACKKVVRFIPTYNPRAIVVALRGGAEKVGILSISIHKGGELYDQVIVAAGV